MLKECAGFRAWAGQRRQPQVQRAGEEPEGGGGGSRSWADNSDDNPQVRRTGRQARRCRHRASAAGPSRARSRSLPHSPSSCTRSATCCLVHSDDPTSGDVSYYVEERITSPTRTAHASRCTARGRRRRPGGGARGAAAPPDERVGAEYVGKHQLEVKLSDVNSAIGAPPHPQHVAEYLLKLDAQQ